MKRVRKNKTVRYKHLIFGCLLLLSVHGFANIVLPTEDVNDAFTIRADTSLTPEEQTVKETVLQFLKFAGSYELDSLPAMLAPNANLGLARFKNDQWKTYTYTFDEFIKMLRAGNPNPYTEPVSEFTVHIESGKPRLHELMQTFTVMAN